MGSNSHACLSAKEFSCTCGKIMPQYSWAFLLPIKGGGTGTGRLPWPEEN